MSKFILVTPKEKTCFNINDRTLVGGVNYAFADMSDHTIANLLALGTLSAPIPTAVYELDYVDNRKIADFAHLHASEMVRSPETTNAEHMANAYLFAIESLYSKGEEVEAPVVKARPKPKSNAKPKAEDQTTSDSE